MDMDPQGFHDQSGSDRRKKPFDIWLALIIFAAAIIMWLIPKTPLIIIIALIVIFVLLSYPVWNFWWIERELWRRCCALLVVAVCLTVLGYYVWPPTNPTPNNSLPVLDIYVGDKSKILHIKNIGNIDVSDIEVYATMYLVKSHIGKEAPDHFYLDHGIDQFSIRNDPIAQNKFLAKGKEFNLDLNNISYFSFYDFPDLNFDLSRTIYCLRIVFRNNLTKQRMICYRFTGASKFIDIFGDHRDINNLTGVMKLEDRVIEYRSIIKKHQMKLFNDDPANLVLQEQEVTPKTEQPKQPIASNVAPEVQVKLIFKDSPLFTAERKQKITVDIDAFRKYLIGLGFDVPKEIPPIGTSSGKGWTYASGSNYGPIFYDSIMIGDKEIDNPDSWRRAIAHYFFEKIFPWHPADIDIESARTWTIWIFGEYFASSYANKRPKKSNGMNGWVNVLWDIRDSCGKDFTNGSLFYASRVEVQNEDEKDFNKYFSKRFIIGSFVLDNNFRNRPKILKILRQYNFL